MLVVPVVVATLAPRCLANWIAKVPTPPEPGLDEDLLTLLQARLPDQCPAMPSAPQVEWTRPPPS